MRSRAAGGARTRRVGRAGCCVLLLAATLACDGADGGASVRARVHALRAAAPPAEREWRVYLGDRATRQWSPLDQIDRSNVAGLEVAWTYHAGAPASAGLQMQVNPLVAEGVLYGVSPNLDLFALDAATGDEIWRFEPGTGSWLASASRGVAWWRDPGVAEDAIGARRIFFGAQSFLYAVDAETGRAIEGFGDRGRIDLRAGLGRDLDDDLMGVLVTTPVSTFEDLVIVGGRVNESEGAAPGHVRAFDARTGALRWIFHTIPPPGEPGHETWPADAWRTAGGANAWAGFAIDAARGLVFVPTGSATPDFYGGDRLGDNLYANSLVALDARTGERVWHRQLVRHDVWDRDLPSPPNLIELARDGAKIPAVAQATKTGHVFVFHRETGAPLYPLREVPVVPSTVAGERVAASQPEPVAPPPFVRQTLSEADLSTRTPEIADALRAEWARLRTGARWIPPSTEGSVMVPGIDGGAEWGGAAWDAASQTLFVNANQVASILQVVESAGDEALSDTAYLGLCASCHGLDLEGDGRNVPSLIGVDERMGFFEFHAILRDGRGRMPPVAAFMPWWQRYPVAWMLYGLEAEDAPIHWRERSGERRFLNAGYRNLTDADGLPGTQPPWGTLTAIDLARGTHRWQIPFGDYPEILAEGGGGLGAENYGGPVVTAGGLLFVAATPDARVRAFDAATGALLFEDTLPFAGFATPAVYEAGGRQYVVIAAGGGKLGQPSGDAYVAYALPEHAVAKGDRPR